MKYAILFAVLAIAPAAKAERINMCYNCKPGGPIRVPPRTPPPPVRPVANPPRAHR